MIRSFTNDEIYQLSYYRKQLKELVSDTDFQQEYNFSKFGHLDMRTKKILEFTQKIIKINSQNFEIIRTPGSTF